MKKQSRKIIPWTYLLLLSIPVGITKLVHDWKTCGQDIGIFLSESWISVLVTILGVIFFIKFNTWSLWVNPDYEKPKDAKF